MWEDEWKVPKPVSMLLFTVRLFSINTLWKGIGRWYIIEEHNNNAGCPGVRGQYTSPLQVYHHHPPGEQSWISSTIKMKNTESEISLIIFIDKEESKSLGWLCWPLDAFVTALSLDSAPHFQQLRICPEYCPFDIKYMSAVTPAFSSVRCFMHALLSFQYVTGIKISVTQVIT